MDSRTYYLSYWVIVLLILFGIAVLGVGAGFVFLSQTAASLEPGGSALWLLFGVALAAGGIWLVAAAISTRVVLAADVIGVHGAMRTRQLARADIAGKRVLSLQYGQKVTVLCPRDARARDLKLPSYLRTDAAWDAWLGAIPDLDVQAERDFEAEVAANAEFGQTPEERLARLASARRIARGAAGTGFAVMLWAYIYPRPYELTLCVLAGLPWLAMVLVARSHGLLRIDSRRGDPRPGIGAALILPAIALAVRAVSDFGMLDLERALIVGAVAAGLCAAIVLKVSGGVRTRGALLLPLVFACAYGYGAVVLANAELDGAPGEWYHVRVLSMYVSRSSRSVSYHLTLDRWGPRTLPNDVAVPRDLYRGAAPGEPVCVHRGPGALGIAWFKVSLCGA